MQFVAFGGRPAPALTRHCSYRRCPRSSQSLAPSSFAKSGEQFLGAARIQAERRVIEDRRGPALKLALALQIGFLRMTGRLLEAVRIVPPALWRHLGEQLGAGTGVDPSEPQNTP
jgi:hypothetical protein